MCIYMYILLVLIEEFNSKKIFSGIPLKTINQLKVLIYTTFQIITKSLKKYYSPVCPRKH